MVYRVVSTIKDSIFLYASGPFSKSAIAPSGARTFVRGCLNIYRDSGRDLWFAKLGYPAASASMNYFPKKQNPDISKTNRNKSGMCRVFLRASIPRSGGRMGEGGEVLKASTKPVCKIPFI